MSVERTDYIIYGVRYNFNDISRKTREILYEHEPSQSDDGNKVISIVDGMMGKYIFIGYILAIGDLDDGINVISVSELLLMDLDDKKIEISAFIKELNVEKDTEPEIYIFTHWS